MSKQNLTENTDLVFIVGYRCRRDPKGQTIPVAALTDPCGLDDEVWSDGHVGPRDSARSES